MTDVYSEIVRLRAQGRNCALCTIVSTKGSTPGKAMMKMLVRDDGSFAGSVGGGCLEAEVLEAALDAMGDERPRMLEFALNERDYPDSGLICGGRLQIYVEPITEARLVLFGGGHVSGAIAHVARSVGFHVTVAEDRAEFASAERHPDAQAFAVGPWSQTVAELAPDAASFLVVCSRGHDGDAEILEALWQARCQPRWLGMIGSRAKRAQIEAQLGAKGVDPAWLAHVRSPMGLAIGARDHAEIAVSVVAEMIAVRRGAPVPQAPAADAEPSLAPARRSGPRPA
ncbi:XdhC family protein [Engelhardtia mirabilis]|uniref:XdhC family protein n=1 Tax=Engelhardtia mirabilis TaxID=2528011 RepID=UPI003AF37C75